MSFQVPVGSALAKKLFSVAIFSAIQHEPGFMMLLSGPAPKQGEFEAKLKGQTSADYPIVKVTDLSKGAGDKVSVDLFNILVGKPVMSDRRLVGRGMSLSNSSMDIRIDQYRGMADSGGRMTQQRTVYNLRGIAQAGLTNWGARLRDQLPLVQLAGARGFQSTADWVVPLTTDSDFSAIVVNALVAPTKNRWFGAGGAADPSAVAASNGFLLSLTDIDRMMTTIAESNYAMQPIKFEGDPYNWSDPTYVLFVTERQWLYLSSRTTTSLWRTVLQNAYERRSAGMRHPLWYGDGGFWRSCLIKPMKRYAIRFLGSGVTGGTSGVTDQVTWDSGGTDGLTYTEVAKTLPSGTTMDRAILLGAQAAAMVYGRNQNSDYFMDWNEEQVDHKNAIEISVATMGGCAKTRFKVRVGADQSAADTDHGVAVIDSFAPDPQSAAGISAIGS